MNRFKNWLIHKLDGYTNQEYLSQVEKTKLTEMKCESVKYAHEKVLDWFKPPIMRVEMQSQKYSFSVIEKLERGVPIDYIKRNICTKLANKLFDDNLIAFDVEDNGYLNSEERRYCGTITILLPVGYGTHIK